MSKPFPVMPGVTLIGWVSPEVINGLRRVSVPGWNHGYVHVNEVRMAGAQPLDQVELGLLSDGRFHVVRNFSKE